jgi:zinc transport system ATP-binding protein
MEEPVASLSGGQQRRVLVARALAAQPELLIMDEPTAGVDAASQDALADVLTRVSAAGTTLLVVTHETGPLAGVLTRAVVVDHGRIRYDGPLAGAEPTDGHGHDDAHCGPEDVVRTRYRMDQPTVAARTGRPESGDR